MDDDDAGEFDAYLEDYLNRYDQTVECESTDQTDSQKKKRRRQHHHHHHHHHHQHRHTKHHKRNKSDRQKRSESTHSDDEENEMLNADLELFLLTNNLSRNTSSQRNERLNNNKKKRKDKNKCKLFKLDKEARLCRRSLRHRLNAILNKTVSFMS